MNGAKIIEIVDDKNFGNAMFFWANLFLTP